MMLREMAIYINKKFLFVKMTVIVHSRVVVLKWTVL
jgi:hypothetical protein